MQKSNKLKLKFDLRLLNYAQNDNPVSITLQEILIRKSARFWHQAGLMGRRNTIASLVPSDESADGFETIQVLAKYGRN